MTKKYDLIVIGGGASGMMAAGRAGERGLRVLLIEKNKQFGKKILITGNGRCNILNAIENEHMLLEKYGNSKQFLYSLFAQFGEKDAFDFFDLGGLPLVVEEYNRVFPKSQSAVDVVRFLVDYMHRGNVEVRTQCAVSGVRIKDNNIESILCGEEVLMATEYIFATGGVSHPETGSTGDGYRWLKQLGHTVVSPTPSLVPLAVKERWVKELSGISLEGMKITFFVDNEKEFKLNGKILFTHFGVSGPLILNSASKVSKLLPTGIVNAAIDMFPKLDIGNLERQIISIFDVNKNKTLKNIISELVPAGITKGMLILLNQYMDVETKVHSVTKEDRKKIVNLFKALPITITGLMGLDRAIVADGGLPLTEVDMKTMRSKKINNLFVTGDLLHINRPSGGFSLQLCWSTGYVAGSNAGKTFLS
jgi:predicted Rossmann fold flavoprotein